MSIVLIIISAIILISAGIGLFFVRYALRRQVSTFEFPEPTDPVVLENIDKIKKHKDNWISQTPSEEWNQTTQDKLRLIANFYPKENSHKYAIVVHGYTSCKEEMYDYSSYFHDWGFNTLVPDNRAHGKSQGKWIGMGWLDSSDVLGWIRKIVEYDNEAQIVLFGVSMGGATVMMTSGLNLPDNVKCVIEDCGYSSVWDQFVSTLKDRFNLPPFPVMNISDLTSRIICGYSLKKASSLDRLKNAKVPMLFIHGTEDTFVPYNMLDKNIAVYNGPYKEVLRVEKATHAESLRVNLDLYLSTAKNFLDKFFNN